jgi:C4-type Zn-finger protein
MKVLKKELMIDCPICGAEDSVTEHTDINDSEYRRGYFKGLLVEYSTCSACGSEFAGPDQINRNAQRARERMNEITIKSLERNSAFNESEREIGYEQKD